MIQIWRVTTLLVVTKARGETPVVGGTLQFHSRIHEQARKYGDVAVAVQKRANQDSRYGTDPRFEQINLIADVPILAGSPNPHHSVIEKFTPVFETLIDLMAFEMAAVPTIGQVDMIDITPPIAADEERSSISYSAPPFDRYIRSVELGAITGRVIGELPATVDFLDSKTAAVLRWFVKALGTNLLHDQFIFLWIALEILRDASDVRVEEPYTGPCQHQIPACPDCGRPTTRMVRGATIKKFLQSYGVPEQQAKELWAMRQLMHGSIPFDSKKLENLGGLVQPLRAAVAAGLKSKLGKTDDDPPTVAAEGLMVHPALGFGGTQRVTAHDFRPL
jgi:hypothetical protein